MLHLPGYNNHPTVKQIKCCIVYHIASTTHTHLAEFIFTNGEGQKTIHMIKLSNFFDTSVFIYIRQMNDRWKIHKIYTHVIKKKYYFLV